MNFVKSGTCVLLFLSFILLANCLENKVWSNTRICWHCLPSRSDPHCFQTGHWKACAKNEFCFVEQRFENGIEVHYRGCKQDASCDSLVSENYLPCTAEKIAEFRKNNPTKPLVCRNCCFEDYCNPTKVMKDTLTYVSAFTSQKDRSKFLHKHKASYVKSIRGRKPKPQEIYYPTFGWINWPPGALKSGLAMPPFDESTTQINEFTALPKKKTSTDCPEVKLQKTPDFIKPSEECTIMLPHACVADGTIVLKVEKFREDMSFINSKRKARPSPICPRTPNVQTMMVYDEGEHYVIINRINHRHNSNLPTKKRGRFFISGVEITDYYSWDTIQSYIRGKGF